MDISTYKARSRIILTVSITIGVASLVGIGLIFIGRGPGQVSAYARVTPAIDQAMEKLDVKPRTVELNSEKAVRVRNAIKRGDYSTAYQITAGVLASSHLQNWRYYPFDDFINGITNANDAVLETQLDAWVAQNKNDAIPLLIRAQYYHDMGWFMRGHHIIRDIKPSDLASFASYMKKALVDVDSSIQANDANPYSFYLRLRILRGFGMTEKLKSTFDEAIAKYPVYYPLYDIILGTLEPRWGGTVEAMYAFVDRYADHAAQYSPLKLLYLSLYRDLLSSASFDCTSYWRDKEKMPQCVASVMKKTIRPSLDSQVMAALQLYDHTDKYQFGIALDPILSEMLRTAGGEAYSGAFLQSAANSMHSDTQLKEDKPSHNDYVIDDAISSSWYAKGFYDNALKKYQEALKDVETTTFPSEEEKDAAVARIYENIAGIHDRLNQYPEMIAYERAAIALGNRTDYEHLVCYGYYRLKDYVRTIATCTKAIEDKADNMFAYYWRGSANRDSGQIDAAVRDLTAVADSQSAFRTSAAIDLSMINFNRNDIQSALNVLNKYTYLYDPNTDTRDNVAVSYNNRCYAYMQLGELKKALDDCTASLKYGSLPDAIRKEQELIKRLKAGETAL